MATSNNPDRRTNQGAITYVGPPRKKVNRSPPERQRLCSKNSTWCRTHVWGMRRSIVGLTSAGIVRASRSAITPATCRLFFSSMICLRCMGAMIAKAQTGNLYFGWRPEDQRAKTLRTAQACRVYNDDDDQKYCFSLFIFRRLASEARPYSDLGPASSARSGAGCRRKLGVNRAVKFICVLLMLSASPCRAADLAADQVRAMLDTAGPDHPADLSGRSLEDLDLSNLDFKRANLSRANLFGAKLVGADFSGANLSGAKLDLAWIMRANFTNADLSNASLLALVVSSGLEISPSEAPVFRDANLAGARIIARLSRLDLNGANFANAKLGADLRNQSMGLMRTDLSGSNLARADFSKADLGRALLRFAELTSANLAGANLSGADLSGADLTGADLTGADATDADLGGAILNNVRGLETVKGLSLPQRR